MTCREFITSVSWSTFSLKKGGGSLDIINQLLTFWPCYFFFQVTGLVLAFLGLVCAAVSVPFGHLNFAHGGLGFVIMIIGLLQPLNAHL